MEYALIYYSPITGKIIHQEFPRGYLAAKAKHELERDGYSNVVIQKMENVCTIN